MLYIAWADVYVDEMSRRPTQRSAPALAFLILLALGTARRRRRNIIPPRND